MKRRRSQPANRHTTSDLVVSVVQPDADLVVSGHLPVLSVREELPDDVGYYCASGHEIDPFWPTARCGCGKPAQPLTVLLHTTGFLPLDAPPWAHPEHASGTPVATSMDAIVARVTLTKGHHPDYCPADPDIQAGAHGPRCHRSARPNHWHHTIGDVVALLEPVPVMPVARCPRSSPSETYCRYGPTCPRCESDPPSWWRIDTVAG